MLLSRAEYLFLNKTNRLYGKTNIRIYKQEENCQLRYAQSFYELFEPINEPPKATLLILHGMQEHSGRYKDFAENLANNGFAVLLYDHLGHGKTAENREELGYFQKENPKQQLIDDAATMAAFLENNYPNISHFLLGHSMGSFIARCLLQNQEADFKGAVIVGTGGKSTESVLQDFSCPSTILLPQNTGANSSTKLFQKLIINILKARKMATLPVG